MFLMRDRTVKTSKKPLAHRKSRELLEKADWVLIPIQHTRRTYIAVAAKRIQETPFTEARIRYHMMFRGLEFGVGQVDPETLWDYYTVEVVATSVEEFYQAIYNVLVFHLIDEMNGYIDHAEYLWSMSVDDIDIQLLNQNVVVDKFSLHIGDDVNDSPFNFQITDYVGTRLKEHFGIYGSESYRQSHRLGGKWETEHCLFIYDVSGEPHWDLVKKCDMNVACRMTQVGFYIWEIGGFLLLPHNEFLPITQIHSATFYIMPLDLSDQDNGEMASICHHYAMPKYEWPPIMDFLVVNGESTSGYETSYHICANHGFDNVSGFSADIGSFQEVAIYIDSLRYLLNVYQEGSKILYASAHNVDDLMKIQYRASTFLYIVVDVDSGVFDPNRGIYPDEGDEPLIVYTDSFEDNLPTVDEIGMIIDFSGN